MDRTSLIGREPHLRMLMDAVGDARRGRARNVMICGEAGSGKTALLNETAFRISGEMRIIRVTGHQAETDLPLSGVHQLLRAARLSSSIPTFGGDPLRDASALLNELTMLARVEPLLLLIDDAQWLDAASRRALVFVARRIDADAVCVLFGVRPPGDTEVAVGDWLQVGPLSRAESLRLLADRFPLMSMRVAAKIADHAHGLPLALCEIPSELSIAQRDGTQVLPGDLPLGRSLTQVFAKRIATLDDRTQLALLAACFEPLSATAFHSTLSALGCSFADFDQAERMGLAHLRDGRCEFRHPMVSAAVRSEAPTQDLVAVHRALASQFSDEPVRVALHLKHDSEIAASRLFDILRHGASAAQEARIYDEAAELWQAAARLDLSPEMRRDCLRRAALCLTLAGAGPEAKALIDALLPDATEELERALLLRNLTTVSLWTRATLPEVGLQIEDYAIEMLRKKDSQLQDAGIEMLCALATATLGVGEFRLARKVCTTLLTHVEHRLSLEQRLLCDVTAVMVGEPGAGVELRSDWTGSYPWQHVLDPATPAGFIVVVLGWLGEYQMLDKVMACCQRAIDTHGSTATALYITGSLAEMSERYRGRWDRALREFENLKRLVVDTDFIGPYPFIALRHAYLLAARGERTACDEARKEAHSRAPVGVPIIAHLDHAVSGLLALAHRDFAEALKQLDTSREIERAVGLAPSGYLSCFTDGFEAAWRIDCLSDERVAELDNFEQVMRQVQQNGMLGLAARCRALIATPDDMDGWFTEAVELLSGQPDGFEVARTHLLWGERLRRARRKSDAHLKLALAHASFVRLEARSWAEQANAELAACGVRRMVEVTGVMGPASQLTPREFEVAREVATGVSNAEAARRLFISERTVEFHLHNVFRKLQVEGRKELGAIMSL